MLRPDMAKLSADDSTNKSAALTMLQGLQSRLCSEMQNHGSDHQCALQALELQVRKDIEGLATYKKSVLGFKKPAHTDMPKMGAHQPSGKATRATIDWTTSNNGPGYQCAAT